MDRRFMFMEKMSSGGCLPPPPGYIHVYDHNIQRSSSLKPLGQSKPKLYVEHHWERRVKANINGPGQITKMTAMTINSKNHYKSSSSEPEGL